MEVGSRPVGDHAPACGAQAVERVRLAAAAVQGARVLHVSVAGSGGSVPDLLGALLPLAADVGVRPEWKVLFGGPELLEVAGQLGQGLQGAESAITDSAWRAYLEACAGAAAQIDGEYDVVVLHDPAALGLLPALSGAARVIWRCHTDASQPDPPAWDRALALLEGCESIVPDASFAPPGLDGARVVAPGIDPLSSRNLQLAPRLAGRALRRLGVDLDRPMVSQLMRLDRWKDPHTALEAFALVRSQLPEVQFALACELDGTGDGWPAVKEITDYAAGQEGLLLLTSYSGLGDLEIGALNQLSRVALRLSLREGFGLAASEAMWRGTPVVGGAQGGTPLQVRDEVDGYLAAGAEEVAARVVELVSDPGLAVEMGQAGRGRVRERFLITRALEGELRMLADHLASKP
jgi:trehalose synthase